jgi:hypothetical protein
MLTIFLALGKPAARWKMYLLNYSMTAGEECDSGLGPANAGNVLIGDSQAALKAFERLLGKYAPEDAQDCGPAVVSRSHEQDSGMAAGSKTADIAEIQIQRDQESTFSDHLGPEVWILCTRDSLIVDSIDLITVLTEELSMALSQILIELDEDLAHLKGTNSSSRARIAA